MDTLLEAPVESNPGGSDVATETRGQEYSPARPGVRSLGTVAEAKEPVRAEAQGEADLTSLKAKWGIYRLGDLGERCRAIGSREQLIGGLVPVRSLSIIVGDSGLGKSPLLYQAGLCIASGTPFLGRSVRKGRVLYLDAENGLGDVEGLAQKISGYLGLDDYPEEFLGWNLNDAPENFSKWGGVAGIVKEVNPDLVIIDPATAFWPALQENNKDASEVLQSMRRIMKEAECSIILVHHTRKQQPETPVKSIADPDVDFHMWFENARGPRAIVNNSDVRLAVDRPARNSPTDTAFVLGGFGRVRGKIPLIHVERVVNDDGEPLGYRQMTGVKLLPDDQQEPFNRLGEEFQFKDAKLIYGKGSQATTDWLGKCAAAGLLEKGPRVYRKIKL